MTSNANCQASAAYHTAQAHRRSLSLEGGAALELAARSCRAALVMVGPHPMEVPCANEGQLFIVMRSWCDVQAAASTAKTAPRFSRAAGAPALALAEKRGTTRAR